LKFKRLQFTYGHLIATKEQILKRNSWETRHHCGLLITYRFMIYIF
jgi:hypothetical protein